MRYIEADIASDLVKYEGSLEMLEASFDLDDKYLIENVVKLREEICNPKYLRLKREQKTFIVSEPLVSKNVIIQL